ncbi:helix-turn-helix domain-containing protein [Paraurantiacibacter namhicola]|uniref:Uncharacterized protein n=1 Tax=Paraurantiacibacter namhicola TaxID=645517 RepID=A0A1C7D6D1_9SPHN|nr:helix-turn-helix transcriptional regulator [Paraurantiacibacter namhicola]ANU07008.1 hypothetical protein A6F65_00686 [Paraurantiacibacter namhicola]
MSKTMKGAASAPSEYCLDDLGTSFKVVLVDSVQERNGPMGPEVYIPDYQGLLKQIAVVRAFHPAKLKAGDIQFLRKSLGIKSKELAVRLDISPEHMSRCESGDKTLAPNSEKVLRYLIVWEALSVAQKALQKAAEKSDAELDHFLSKISEITERVEKLMDGLTIDPLHNAEEELVFHFTLVSHDESAPANDDGEAPAREWLAA